MTTETFQISDPPPRGPGSAAVFVVWACVGLVFAFVQFAVSEGLYRVAELGFINELYDVSDAVAWPAGIIYDHVESNLYQRELEAFIADTSHAPELRERARDVLGKFGEEEFWESAWGFFEDASLNVEVNVYIEYLIYGGVCLGWGALVAVFGSAFTLVVRAGARDEGV